jgi:hypothetical protein
LSFRSGKGKFRFDHPEFGEMPAGVAVFGPERRSEGINLRQRAAVGLDVQLAADREKRLFAEEITGEVGAAVWRARNGVAVGEIERADAEHLAGAFGIARGDDRACTQKYPRSW